MQPVNGRRIPTSSSRVRRDYPAPKSHNDHHEIINYVYEGKKIVYDDTFLLRFLTLTKLSGVSAWSQVQCAQKTGTYLILF